MGTGGLLDTDDFRAALIAAVDDGWDSPAGRDLLKVVRHRCRTWAPRVDRRCGLTVGTTDPDTLLSASWLTLSRFTRQVLEARCPWAYLWTAVTNAATVDNTADALTSSWLPRRRMAAVRDIAPPLRVGLESHLLDRAADALHPPAAADPTSRWSPALLAFLDRIVERGGDRCFWIDAVDRAVDVLADARKSYEEYELRRDPYLRATLGLSPDQLSALGALLIGTRRGDRARQSLLRALVHDIDATSEDIPGAPERLAVLLAAA